MGYLLANQYTEKLSQEKEKNTNPIAIKNKNYYTNKETL
jgi:hypothetical protein